MAAKSFEDNLIRQATDAAWLNYGQFISNFDAQADRVHEANLKYINLAVDEGLQNPRLIDQVSEQTEYDDLLKTCGNMELNNVMIVFAKLCSELNHLAVTGLRQFVDPISIYGEARKGNELGPNLEMNDATDLHDMSRFIGVLWDLHCYINRSFQSITNTFEELNVLFTNYKKSKTPPTSNASIEVDGIRFDMVFQYLGRLLVTLINIEEILNNQVLRRDFVNYKRIVELATRDVTKFSIPDTDSKSVKKLFVLMRTLEAELIDSSNLTKRLTDLLGTLSITIGRNQQICDQLIAYIRISTSTFESEANRLKDDKQFLELAALFVVFVWLFKKDDKKMLKQLLDTEKKTYILTVHMRGNVTVLPDRFLIAHLPKSMHDKRQLDAINIQRDSLIKSINLEREMKRLNYRLINWLITFECVTKSSQDPASNNLVGNLMKQSASLEDGLELAIQTNYLARNYIYLHLNYGKAMTRSDLASVCKLVSMLKAIEISFERRKADLLLIINTYAQYNSCIALNSLSLMKKRLLVDVNKYSEKKLDIFSAVILASNCFHGPILTEARQTITSLCLAFLIQSMQESEHLKILPAFNKIEWTSRALDIMRDNCCCDFMYFNRIVLGTYFNFVHETELGKIRDLRYFFQALNDCTKLIRRAIDKDPKRCEDTIKKFEQEVWTQFKTEYLDKLCTEFETELRLQVHLELQLDDPSPFKRRMQDFRTPLSCEPFRFLGRFISIGNYVQNYLNEVTYNMTTTTLHDWKTYESMLNLAKFRYGLKFPPSQLPTQTIEQGLDVLEITRNIHIFVARYQYNLNVQTFIEKSSENKHLNVLLIRHVANSIQTHGFGIINTAVNFTYQFLRKKFNIFLQFLFEEHIKSRLLKDLRSFRESKATKWPYERADKFVKGIRKLGLTTDGLSFLDQFRLLITEIGNALGFVRMLRSGALHCSSISVNYVPDLDDLADVRFEQMAQEDGFSGDCLEAARNLDYVLSTLNRNFGEATDYFRLLVNVFAPTFRDPKNYHLRNFYVILPALTINYVEQSIIAKEKMNRKNKTGASFTDDGFAMGVAYILNLLDQHGEFEGLQWFSSARDKIAIERNDAIKIKNSQAQSEERVTQTTSLTLKRLEVLQKEFDLLDYNLVSCKILFKGATNPIDTAQEAKE